MSLLDTGNTAITVYLEELVIDADGNKKTRPSDTGIPAQVRVEISNQSGTSSRRAEGDVEGFETEQVYRIRFPRSWPHRLGAQSRIEWDGNSWAVFGEPQIYNRSPKTAHLIYTIRRF
jgi:hypothetical protein